MFFNIRNLITSKQYLLRNPNTLNCISRYINTISIDQDLINFHYCINNGNTSMAQSEYRYLGDILIYLSIGSLENVILDQKRQTLADIIGINTSLKTSNKTSLISAINEVLSTANNAFNTSGNGLTASGNTINVGAGNGITVNENDISLTYQVGNLTTMNGSPTSVVAILGTSALATTATTIIAAINEVRATANNAFNTASNGLTASGTSVNIGARNGIKLATTSGLTTYNGSLSIGADKGITVNTDTIEAKIDGTTVTFSTNNALQTPILVRKADNSADTTIDVIVGGSTPTGAGKGLAKLNQDITVTDSVVAVSNSLFTQKIPTLLFQCQDSNSPTRTFLESVLKSPYSTEISSLSKGNKCLDFALKVASGNPSIHTVNAISKADCQSLVTTQVMNLGNSAFKTAMQDSVYIAGAITAEVCAQFFDV
ncbi:MAG: hypothetical protein KBC27_00805 [Rickettsiales bacterium]|nr:hypothetical protein [Rickettsiales bacterium]